VVWYVVQLVVLLHLYTMVVAVYPYRQLLYLPHSGMVHMPPATVPGRVQTHATLYHPSRVVQGGAGMVGSMVCVHSRCAISD